MAVSGWVHGGARIALHVAPNTRSVGSTFAYAGNKYKVTGIADQHPNSFGHFAGLASGHLSAGSNYRSGRSSLSSLAFGDGSSGSFRGGSVLGGQMSFGKIPKTPSDISSDYMTETDPNQEGRSQEQQEDKGEEKVLREFDYVRDDVKGKGLVMGIVTPPPNQVVTVKLNAGHIFLPFESINLTLLGHVYQVGHLPDAPT